GKPVDDAAAPILAGLQSGCVDPHRMAGRREIVADALDQRRVVVVTIAKEYLHSAAPPVPDRNDMWQAGHSPARPVATRPGGKCLEILAGFVCTPRRSVVGSDPVIRRCRLNVRLARKMG